MLKKLILGLLLGLILGNAAEASNPSTSVVVNTISQLRTLPASQLGYETVQVLGYRTNNDGGQGLFQYTGTSTCTDNNGTLIQAVGGCYQRQINFNSYSPFWFGAYCDNSHDDTTAINNTLTAASSGSTVLMPSSICSISNTLFVNTPLLIKFPSGGGLQMTAEGAFMIEVHVSGVEIDGASGATLNGTRNPVTGSDYIADSGGIFVGSLSHSTISNIKIKGLTIQNIKYVSIYVEYCNFCQFSRNELINQSYAGILCITCLHGSISENYINSVSSSNGPGSSTSPTGTLTNAYGITATQDGSGAISQNMWISGNHVVLVPTWECYDTHDGYKIHFIGNTCEGARVGVQVTSIGSSIAPLDNEVIGNSINCSPLNSPIYPGGPSISIGGPGIFVSGTGAANSLGTRISDNSITNCGTSNSLIGPQNGSIVLQDSADFIVNSNVVVTGIGNGVQLLGFASGIISSTDFLNLTPGPLAVTPNLISVGTNSANVILSQNLGDSPNSYGYFITAQSGTNEVGIARSNYFTNLISLYNPSGPSTNRVDLGATAP